MKADSKGEVTDEEMTATMERCAGELDEWANRGTAHTSERASVAAREMCGAASDFHAARYRSYPMAEDKVFGLRIKPKSVRDEFLMWLEKLEGAYNKAKAAEVAAEEARERAKGLAFFLEAMQPQIKQIRHRMCAPPGPHTTTRI